MKLQIIELWRRQPAVVIARFFAVFGTLMMLAGGVALFGGVHPYIKLAIGLWAWMLVFVLALCQMAAP